MSNQLNELGIDDIDLLIWLTWIDSGSHTSHARPWFSVYFTLLAANVTNPTRTAIKARDKRVIEAANAGHNAMISHLEKHKPGARPFNESAQRQVDKIAKHIINVYGNLVNVNQEIDEITDSGSVVAVKIGAGDKKIKPNGTGFARHPKTRSRGG